MVQRAVLLLLAWTVDIGNYRCRGCQGLTASAFPAPPAFPLFSPPLLPGRIHNSPWPAVMFHNYSLLAPPVLGIICGGFWLAFRWPRKQCVYAACDNAE